MSITVETQTPKEERNLWGTPPEVVAELEAIYGTYDIDAAAGPDNTKKPLWLGPDSPLGIEDCLTVSWNWATLHRANPQIPPLNRILRVFLNPPYSAPYPFVAKAHQEARAGRAMVTCLLAASTGVSWWHRLVWNAEAGRFRPGVDVRFMKRIRHVRPDGSKGDSPTFASVAVTFFGGL